MTFVKETKKVSKPRANIAIIRSEVYTGVLGNYAEVPPKAGYDNSIYCTFTVSDVEGYGIVLNSSIDDLKQFIGTREDGDVVTVEYKPELSKYNGRYFQNNRFQSFVDAHSSDKPEETADVFEGMTADEILGESMDEEEAQNEYDGEAYIGGTLPANDHTPEELAMMAEEAPF